YETIAGWLSQKNAIVGGYLWHIFIIGLAMAYFEVFFAWVKVQMKTVFGNFMKEVFHRVGAMVLLFCLYFEVLTIEWFFVALAGVYVLRMLLMLVNAFYVRLPVFRFDKIDKIAAILKYSSLIIVAGSIATMILDIDKFMLNHYIEIEKVAYYSVAVFIAMVIAVPQRAMHQILMPLTAQFINENNKDELYDLYKRSSLTLLIISGFIFLLIILNIKQLYHIIPEEFSGGLYVVLLVSVAKLYDNLLGNNNAILFNSDYYRMVLVFGVVLAISAVVLNIILIPLYGINGSALATMLAVVIYNTIKIIFVKSKFNMQPFGMATLKVLLVILICAFGFYFWDFSFNPYVNILLKSACIGLVYGISVLKLNLSEDITTMVKKYTGFN
ncbi:MAG: polysaccharide biosynthesis C-terminal domain-containing protein, partial [Psychroserpens sp.]|nr:polysaccharide biosynthesis C-terminal domain-containing protein [Psychroserpens sp.]